MTQLPINSYQLSVQRINFRICSCFQCLIFIFIFFIANVFCIASETYTKVLNLNKELVKNENSPDFSVSKKLKLHLQILDTSSKITGNENCTPAEINKLLDIILSIVKENKSILHKEIIMLNIVKLILHNNITITDESDCVKKITEIMKNNLSVGRSYPEKRLYIEYDTMKLLKKYNCIKAYIKIANPILNRKLICTFEGKPVYNKLLPEIAQDMLDSIDHKKQDKFLGHELFSMGHSLCGNRQFELGLKILRFVEDNYTNKNVAYIQQASIGAQFLAYMVPLKDKKKGWECVQRGRKADSSLVYSYNALAKRIDEHNKNKNKNKKRSKK